MWAGSCARMRTRPRPKSTTTSMSGLASSPPCSPSARPATPVSGSPTRAGSHSLQAPARTANQLGRRSEIRILYILDPRRNAVLLVAGDKAGKWDAWYRQAIPLAEQRYEHYLKQEDIR